jgi:hypothetical protein
MTINDFKNEIKSFEKKDEYASIIAKIDDKDIEYKKIIASSFKIYKKAVLGIDIYQYSQYETEKQILIPVVFSLILEETKRWCENTEKIIFYDYDFKQPSIDTGDGGFFIFDNPLQALIFNININAILKTFNTGHFYPGLRHFIGEITLRTCITYDIIYQYDGNIYGSGIINNARILSKDKLNRFIIDENSNVWFNLHTGGLDNIQSITLQDLYKEIIDPMITKPIKPFIASSIINLSKEYKLQFKTILNVHLQKIGTVLIKKAEVSVYNVEMQIRMNISDEIKNTDNLFFITSLGNLNSEGLS